MSITQRNDSQISGRGTRTLVPAHGFGCGQSTLHPIGNTGNCPQPGSAGARAAAVNALLEPMSV